MATEEIKGFDEFKKRFEVLKNSSDRVNVLFMGDNEANGQNWCPDCRQLDDLLEKVKPELSKTQTKLITVRVGDRTAWKSPESPFRHDPALKLTSIPTLFNVKTGEKEDNLKSLLTKENLLSKFGV